MPGHGLLRAGFGSDSSDGCLTGRREWGGLMGNAAHKAQGAWFLRGLPREAPSVLTTHVQGRRPSAFSTLLPMLLAHPGPCRGIHRRDGAIAVSPSRRDRRLERLSRRRLHRLLVIVLAVLMAVMVPLTTSMLDSPMVTASTTTATATSVRRSRSRSEPASRSEDRRSLSTVSSGDAASKQWSLGESNTSLDVDRLSAPSSSNAVVSGLLAQDVDILPEGFDPDHVTGDVGNSYSYSQCTWWAYVRRHQLGLPVGSHLGDGHQWATSAEALGYWVDSTPRHKGDIMVFAAGQDGANAVYGHVAIIEKINADGSIVTSESGESHHGRTFSRTFTAAQASAFRYIHY